MTPEEKECVQARADKLLARINHLENENSRLSEAVESFSLRNRELEREKQEAREETLEAKRENKTLRAQVSVQAETIEGLHKAMAELRDILLLDESAQGVLNALKQLRKYE